jgi:hypothetical protein
MMKKNGERVIGWKEDKEKMVVVFMMRGGRSSS